MEATHRPVFLRETLEHLGDVAGRAIVDATLGTGAFARHLVEAGAFVIGIDRDPDALKLAAENLAGLGNSHLLIHGRMSGMEQILADRGYTEVHGVVIDAGISMVQMLDPQRGFTAHSEVSLDMRMDPGEPGSVSAHQIVNEYLEKDLVRVFRSVGRGREALRVADRIVRTRKGGTIHTTAQLADTIAAAIAKYGPPRRMDAARYLTAIRAEANSEATELAAGVEAACRLLSPETRGTLVVLTYQSAEHSLCKRTLRQLASPCQCNPALPCVCEKVPTVELLTKKALFPDEREVAQNPAARSARLFAARRLPAV